MSTVTELVQLRSGGVAQMAIYGALLRMGLREPRDFILADPPVDFILPREGTALAIVSPGNRAGGLATLRSAALQGQGIRVDIVEEAEAVLNPERVVSRLLDRRG